MSRIVYFHGENVIRREEDSAGRGRMDIIEIFSQGRVSKRLRDTKGTGQWDTVNHFQGNELAREERDTDADGFLDLRIFYEKGVIVRQEADTNGDRKVDVWVRFQDGERVEQLEDQKIIGKISARYLFKGEQLIGQEEVPDSDPPADSAPFVAVAEEVRNMAAPQVPPGAATNEKGIVSQGLVSGGEIK
jgi:hypothetical protein